MKHIFYKERIKLNRILLAVIIINISVLIYTFFRVRIGIMLNEPSGIWLDIILRNGIFFSSFFYQFEIKMFNQCNYNDNRLISFFIFCFWN